MKVRALVLIAIVALFASLAPSAAYADLYDELDGNYDGEMWRNEVNANSNNGFDSPGTGYASVNLILSDIYQFNADLLARGQSPAGQLAIQLTQLDFIRGAYGRLTQIKTQVENIYLDTAYLRSGMTQVNSYLGGMQYNLSLVKTAVESLDDNVDIILQNQVVIGTAVENIRQNLISANGKIQDINTGINGTGSNSVRNLLSTLAGNQYAMSNQLRNYFANDIDGDGTYGLIYGILYNINERVRNIFSKLNDILQRLVSINNDINTMNGTLGNFLIANHTDIENVISAINDLDLSVDIPESISISNWPEWPSFQPIIDAINSLGKSLDSINNALTDYEYIVNGEYGIDALIKRLFNNQNAFQGLATPWNQMKQIIESLNNPNLYQTIDGKNYFNILGTIYRLFFNPKSWHDGQLTPYWYFKNTYEVINNGFGEFFEYLTNFDGLLKQIRDLLSVSNPDELVGDFDTVEFETSVDDLVSRLATIAPFGALLMVSAELDILHSVSAIQNPSFVFPFEFFGQNAVMIDLSFMADARPLFNFVVVFGFIYMLLIYSIDFIKEGEL